MRRILEWIKSWILKFLKYIISSALHSEGKYNQVHLCKKVICELDQWLGLHTHTYYGGMGTPSVPVVSDLCGPITQVIQWVTIKKAQLGTVALQREERINQ